MRIVIDIPEVFYEALRKTDEIIRGQRSGKTLMSVIYNAVSQGIPLPKGHGRLIDADALKAEIMQWQRDISNPEAKRGARLAEAHYQDLINKSPTIIEADKAESEGEVLKCLD